MVELLTITILGFVIGIFTNLVPIVGGSLFNFIVGVIIVSYQQLAQAVINLPLIPLPIYAFTLAYFVGIFVVKLGSLIPSPVQPLFIALRGNEL